MAAPLTELSISPMVDSSGDVIAGGTLQFVSVADPNTQVNVYRNAEATLAWTQPITLDGGGKVNGAVYVRDPCRMLASDANGALLRDIYYPGAVTAENVEVKSTAFNGSVGAATTAGAQTWLKSVLDKSLTSFGGTDWKHKDASGGTERSYVEVIREFGISVKSYGAAGDGVADDLAAINATIAKLKANGGGLMFFPPGTYNISDALSTIDFDGLTVEFLGGSIVQTTVNNKNIFTVTGARFQCINPRLEIAPSVGGNSTGYGISITGVDDCAIRNPYISTVTTSQVFDQAIRLYNSSNSTIENGYLFGDGEGIYVFSNASDASNVINGVRIFSATAAGLHLQGVNFCTISNCYIDTGATAEINGVSCSRIALTGNMLVSTGLIIDSGCSYWTDGGNQFNSVAGSVTTGGSHRWTSTAYDGGSVASANSLTLTRAGMHSFYTISGTTTVNTIATAGFNSGQRIALKFSGALQLTNEAGGAGQLHMNGNVNFTTAAGDVVEFVNDGTDWYEIGRCDT